MKNNFRKQALVCLIDLLGTKYNYTDEYVRRYFSSLENIRNSIISDEKKIKKLKVNKNIEFKCITFSDSLLIILSENNDDKKFLSNYLGYFSQYILGIFQQYFAEELFPRGAISFGEIFINKNDFLGPVIDDVSEYFEKQEMIGICTTPKLVMAIDLIIECERLNNKNYVIDFLIKYKTPFKENNLFEVYQINYIDHFLEKNSNVNIDPYAIFCNFFSNRNINQQSINKIKNTLDFFQYVSSKNIIKLT